MAPFGRRDLIPLIFIIGIGVSIIPASFIAVGLKNVGAIAGIALVCFHMLLLLPIFFLGRLAFSAIMGRHPPQYQMILILFVTVFAFFGTLFLAQTISNCIPTLPHISFENAMIISTTSCGVGLLLASTVYCCSCHKTTTPIIQPPAFFAAQDVHRPPSQPILPVLPNDPHPDDSAPIVETPERILTREERIAAFIGGA